MSGTDIVKQLRTESGVNYPEGRYLSEIMDDAADEIERLLAILRDIERALAAFTVESEP